MTAPGKPEAGRKFDGGKRRWTLLPLAAVESVVDVLEFGARKYAPGNWVKVPNARARYIDAAFRHLVAAAKGEEEDPESGLPHLAHACCCLLFALWFDVTGAYQVEETEDPTPAPPEVETAQTVEADPPGFLPSVGKGSPEAFLTVARERDGQTFAESFWRVRCQVWKPSLHDETVFIALHVGGSASRHRVEWKDGHPGTTAGFDIAAMLPGAVVSAVRITREAFEAREPEAEGPVAVATFDPTGAAALDALLAPYLGSVRDTLSVERVGLVGNVERWTFTRSRGDAVLAVDGVERTRSGAGPHSLRGLLRLPRDTARWRPVLAP